MAKKAKRGVKLGTKRGPYKKARRPSRITLDSPQYAKLFEADDAKIGTQLRIRLPNDFTVNETANLSVGKSINLTLCEQLEETITRLENRVSNSIARINALIGQI